MLSSALDVLIAAGLATLWQLAFVLGPAAACAIALHQIERLTQGLLVRTFGWRAVLLTGWIGTPVHELSHVAACLVFMHEIEEVKLFSPDPESGTLGLVRHRAPVGNPWAEMGRFFIGVAPLVGGALALHALALWLLPDESLARLWAMGEIDGTSARVGFAHATRAAAALLAPAHLVSPRFWLFLYLATCIGSHLAPSLGDLKGAARGAITVLVLLLVTNLVAQSVGGVDVEVVLRVASFTTPLVALLVFALVLTAVVERARGGDGGHLRRFVSEHALRLTVAAAACLAFAIAAGV
jgi:hypothetical protein